MVDIELLQAGSGDGPPTRRPSGARWLARLIGLAVVTAVVALAVTEVAPSLTAQRAVALRLLLVDPDGLFSMDVDSGQVTQILRGNNIDEVHVSGGVAVARVRNIGRLSLDLEYSYNEAGEVRPLGGVDRVVPNPNGGMWFILDATDRFPGSVWSARTAGGFPNRTSSIPMNRQVVGATTDGLVTLRGGERDRTLQVWDPQLQEVIRSLGLVTGVVGVESSSILVSRGCLSKGCVTALVDGVTGEQTPVTLPVGWTGSGPAVLSPDGTSIAQVVATAGGTVALAYGPPSNIVIDDSVSPAVGSSVVLSDDGWVVLTRADGDAVLLRGSQQRTVELPPLAEVVGVLSVG